MKAIKITTPISDKARKRLNRTPAGLERSLMAVRRVGRMTYVPRVDPELGGEEFLTGLAHRMRLTADEHFGFVIVEI